MLILLQVGGKYYSWSLIPSSAGKKSRGLHLNLHFWVLPHHMQSHLIMTYEWQFILTDVSNQIIGTNFYCHRDHLVAKQTHWCKDILQLSSLLSQGLALSSSYHFHVLSITKDFLSNTIPEFITMEPVHRIKYHITTKVIHSLQVL